MVVFGHLPEDADNFLLRYICTFHMPLFFFISGYLSKRQAVFPTNLRKYWQSLIVPYFLYNAIFYPYWIIRYTIEDESNLSVTNIVIKPLFGVLFGQIETQISSILSGVTWFLIALLMMRIMVDACNQYKRSTLLMLLASLSLTAVYIASDYYHIMNNLLMRGFLRCTPFYVLGHLMGRWKCYSGTNFYFQAITALILYAVSIILFFMTNHPNSFGMHIIRVYSVPFTAIFAVLNTCKLFNSKTSQTLINISSGTIMIMGLHWMIIGTINYAIQKLLTLGTEIRYEWYTALFLSVSIVTIIYPFILLAQRRLPILLGR